MNLLKTTLRIIPTIFLSLIICSPGLACSQPSAIPPQQLPQTPQQQAQPHSTPPAITQIPASPASEKKQGAFRLTSAVFKEGAAIPARYACTAEDYSPQLAWQNAPPGTKSFAIIVDDPDGFNWVHWVIFNLPPDISQLTENVKAVGKLDNGAVQGSNSFGSIGYRGPCPPNRHHYYFTIYALDSMLDVREGTTKPVLLNAMQGHIRDKATLVGVFP